MGFLSQLGAVLQWDLMLIMVGSVVFVLGFKLHYLL